MYQGGTDRYTLPALSGPSLFVTSTYGEDGWAPEQLHCPPKGGVLPKIDSFRKEACVVCTEKWFVCSYH
jgi:hypothetical protein